MTRRAPCRASALACGISVSYRRSVMRRIVTSITALALFLTAVRPAPAQYRIVRTFNVGGDGGWDYIVPDAPHRRLFIGRQDRVMVVGENDGKLIGEVTGIKG